MTTPEGASTYGFSIDMWKHAVGEAIDADYERMADLGRRIVEILAGAREVQVRSDRGTDLCFPVLRRMAHIEDGIVDETDISNGRPFTSLPTGYLSMATLEDGAE